MTTHILLKNLAKMLLDLREVDQEFCDRLTETRLWVASTAGEWMVSEVSDGSVCKLSDLLEVDSRINLDRFEQKVSFVEPITIAEGHTISELSLKGTSMLKDYLQRRRSVLKAHLIWNVNDTGISEEEVLNLLLGYTR